MATLHVRLDFTASNSPLVPFNSTVCPRNGPKRRQKAPKSAQCKPCRDCVTGIDPSMNQRRWSTPIYKGRGESLHGLDPAMNHRRGSTPIHKGCTESLKGVDPSTILRWLCALIYKGCSESWKGLDPSMNHRRGSTPTYKGWW